jgi:hemerythrin-like domain-containing protein
MAVVYHDMAVLFDNLIRQVTDLNLPHGLENSLCTKLNAAMKAIKEAKPGNDVGAINAMEAFINKVEAHRGKKILSEDANALVTKAQAIIARLSGSP